MARKEELVYVVKAEAEFQQLKSAIENTKKTLNSLTLPNTLKTRFDGFFNDLNKGLDSFRDQLNKGVVDNKGFTNLKRSGNEILSIYKQISNEALKAINPESLLASYSSESVDRIRSDLSNLQKQLENFGTLKDSGVADLQAIANKLNAQYDEGKGLPKAVERLNTALANMDFHNIKQIENWLKRLGTLNSLGLGEELQNAVKKITTSEEELELDLQKTEEALRNQIAAEFDVTKATEQYQSTLENTDHTLKTFINTNQQAAQSSVETAREVDQLANRFKQFLSIGNSILLFRRALTSAYRTIKELDAAMTETATVTDYSVGQMWQKLDEYTAIANRLGATTLGTYKTITLFFQQGLDEAQSLALATETMKMARVAGIDYAEATQYMTSALRGFNMELNETSATRVNDVYSELAKITAADTNQIAVAMSKVASLANSANMELETTSAFLSQIIETTQEAPETAGTALKTIIARFSEVKRLFSQGELTGADEEGETIDVNKIGTALRTVGIDLNKYVSGAVGLDEIFLQLAEKWEGLDLVTQRYIATQAAGSRQQSRFIAMMQNYERTMELVNAAYNSAGSGQEQFDKTLESLEAKVNKLKNAWDNFTMAITDNSVVKGAVDLLTGLLTVVNRLADSLPGLGSKLGGVFRILAGYGLLKAGRAATAAYQSGFQNTLAAMPEGQKDYFAAMQGGKAALGNAIGGFRGTLRNYFAGPSWDSTETAQKLAQAQAAEQSAWNAVGEAASKDIYNYNQAEYDAAIKNWSKLSTELKKVEQEANASKEAFQKNVVVWNKAGAAITTVSTAVTLLGIGLQKLGEDADNEALAKLGETLTKIGASGVAIGQLSMQLPNLAQKLGMTTLATTGWIAAIIAAIGAIASVVEAVKRYNQHTVDLYNSSSKTLDKLTEINKQMDTLGEMQNNLDSLTKGSADWYIQLEKIHQAIEELIALDPDLKDFLTFDPEKGFVFDEAAQAKYEEYKKQEAQRAATQRAIADVHSTQTKDAYLSNVPTTLDTVQYKEQAQTKYDSAALNSFYDLLTQAQVEQVIAEQSQYAKTFSIDRAKEMVEQATGITDLQGNEWYDYLEEYLIQRELSAMQNARQQVIEDNSLRDKKGQTLYANYEGEELSQYLDLGLDSDKTATALKDYWETLEKLPKILQDNQDALKATALETSAAMTNYEKLNDAVKDNQQLLSSGVKKATAYKVAIGELYEAAKTSLGNAVSVDFIEDHVDQFIKAFVEGSETAFLQIQKDLIETFDIEEYTQANNLPIQINSEDFSAIQQAILDLTQDKEFILNGVADFTDIYNKLMQIPGMTAQIAQAMIQALTLEAQFIPGEDGYKVVVTSPGLGNVRNIGAGSKSKNGGGGSKQKEKAWENPYDQLYNLTEANEEAIRQRNLLEKQYNAILRDRESTVNALALHSLEELANLQQQLAYQRQLQAGRQAQLNAVSGETWTDNEGNRKSYAAWGVTQYASYNQNTRAIEIDWDAIDKVTDQTKGKAIEDYIKRLEELQKQFEETDSTILDIEAEIDEINRRSKDEYLSLEQRVYDAIVKQHQEVIDAYSSFNDTLNDTNDKIMDGLREQIDLERQIRDNTKTEEDIAQKEARLAYLSRDTSGANATETLRLQKEIDDARQAYSDSLIDQQIDSIEKGNEKAAEQRQIQIKTMQEQLNYWQTTGAFWNETHLLLQNAFDENGNFKPNTQLVSLLKSAENFGGLSDFGKMDWFDDLAEEFMTAQEGFAEWKMEEARKKGEITQDGNTYTYDKDKKAWMLGGEAYSAVYDPVSGNYVFTRTKSGDVKTGTIGTPQEEIKASPSGSGSTGYGGSQRGGGEEIQMGTILDTYKVTYGNWSTNITADSVLDAKGRAYSQYAQYLMQQGWSAEKIAKGLPLATFLSKLVVQKYASGGFADFTGPAWLDGSKSKPEAVLSAKQTELFISLRDMLEKFGQTGGFNNATGNTYVDLDVNADIGSDYDVDSLVARLKRDILDSSSYRNVNMLSRGH